MRFNIGIICGHGDGDPGACDLGRKEANIVRKLAPYVKKNLLNYKDVNVEILDTSKNWYDYVQSHNYNFSRFNYIIELHANAGVHDPQGNGHTTGIEVYVTPREQGISVEQEICKEIASLGFKNRGVKRAEFLVINCIKDDGVSACLIENGFVGDKDDMDLLHKDMNKYASKIASGIAKGFKLEKKPQPTPSGQPHKVAVYMTTYGNFRFINLDPRDKIVTHKTIHGLFKHEIEICGNRNLYDKYDAKKEKGHGDKHGLKNKGDHLFVAFADELEFDINSKM